MGSKDWRENWEAAASTEHQSLGALPLEALMTRVNTNALGSYYGIWDAIALKADLRTVGWRLFSFLRSEGDYLHRYHCARTLLGLMGCTKYDPADLTAPQRNPAVALAEIARLLDSSIGPPR
jgi:hypothetical protein